MSLNIMPPHGLKGRELFDFLRENEEKIMQHKKSVIKYTEPVSFDTDLFLIRDRQAIKAKPGEPVEDTGTLRVTAVANAAYWCDSHMDVLLPDCWKKSIKDRKPLIPHLHDHIHRIDAKIGDVVNIYGKDISLTELGLSRSGTTQCLIFETDVKKEYNKMVYDQYRLGKINQHSIGLNYIRLGLALNDDEDTAHYDLWEKHIDKVINKEFVIERGYFWVVPEIRLLENSCVLFGSNELTPTLDIAAKTSGFDIYGQPTPDVTEHKSDQQLDSREQMSKLITETKFINL